MRGRITILTLGFLLVAGPGCNGSEGDGSGTGGMSAGGSSGGGSSNGGARTGGSGGVTSAGRSGSGGSGGAQTGCAGVTGTPCPTGQTCCAGVPYPSSGICLAQCVAVSDRALKTGLSRVDSDAILERVSNLPISEWSYREEGAGVRHIGPMAQDFRAAFGLGADERHIHPVDASGVALASIQALAHRLAALEQENRRLEQANRELAEQVRALGPGRGTVRR
jgi:hypothetical protein